MRRTFPLSKFGTIFFYDHNADDGHGSCNLWWWSARMHIINIPYADCDFMRLPLAIIEYESFIDNRWGHFELHCIYRCARWKNNKNKTDLKIADTLLCLWQLCLCTLCTLIHHVVWSSSSTITSCIMHQMHQAFENKQLNTQLWCVHIGLSYTEYFYNWLFND